MASGPSRSPASRRRTPLQGAWIVLPVGLQLVVYLLGPRGSRGAFQAAAAAVVVGGGLAAFPVVRDRGAWRLLVPAVLAPVAVHAVLAGLPGALALAWIGLGVGALAAGWAQLGRGLGVSAAGSGVVAATFLATVLTSTSWADAVSTWFPQPVRGELVQACVYADPLLALAYDAADHDRLHDADVYAALPLASRLIDRPRALPTGLLWLVVGCLLGASGAACARLRRR